jgi:Sulfatase
MNKSLVRCLCLFAALGLSPFGALAQSGKPNILVIFTDDVGVWNLSAYHRGMMGGSTPNIDRIANEGALFTDYYAQQSCTAGRAAFITGQQPFRVGLPGAPQGLQAKDPTIAELLKPRGWFGWGCGRPLLPPSPPSPAKGGRGIDLPPSALDGGGYR